MNETSTFGRGRRTSPLPFETPLGIETTRWFGSILDLFRAALDSAQAGDEAALRTLRINEFEYGTMLWPEFPVHSRSLYREREIWKAVDARCRRTEAWLCRRLRGRVWEVDDIRFSHGTDVYRSFSIHRGTFVTVRSSEGKGTLAVLGGIVDYAGRYKLLSLLEP